MFRYFWELILNDLEIRFISSSFRLVSVDRRDGEFSKFIFYIEKYVGTQFVSMRQNILNLKLFLTKEHI